METSEFGFWAMLVFWGSAIGGIVLGISWAKRRGGNPVARDLLQKSLKARFEKGELDKDEYNKRLAALSSQKKDEK